MKEIWKLVENFPKYEVSNFGRVKSRWLSAPRIVKGHFAAGGYHQITLYEQKKRFYFFIHRLVLEAFIGKCPEGYECNHKDGNKVNNELTNLEWATHGINLAHAYALGSMTRKGEAHPRAKLKEKDIIEIRRLAKKGVFHRAIAKMYNVSRPHIGDIVDRSRWPHIKEE